VRILPSFGEGKVLLQRGLVTIFSSRRDFGSVSSTQQRERGFSRGEYTKTFFQGPKPPTGLKSEFTDPHEKNPVFLEGAPNLFLRGGRGLFGGRFGSLANWRLLGIAFWPRPFFGKLSPAAVQMETTISPKERTPLEVYRFQPCFREIPLGLEEKVFRGFCEV